MASSLLHPQPPSSPEVIGASVAAVTSANQTKTEPGDLHLAAALLRIGSVATALRAAGVDVDKAQDELAVSIRALPPRPGLFSRVAKVFRDSRVALDPVHRERARAARCELPELTAPFTLAVVAEESKEVLVALSRAGFRLRDFRYVVAHGGAETVASTPGDGPVRVVIHNDPFTTMELVQSVLTEVFGRSAETAKELMTRVHKNGEAELASMDAKEAAARIAAARARAVALDFPLRIEASPAATA
jgi:ATP-dependent Clp protease adapter protein ClpS